MQDARQLFIEELTRELLTASGARPTLDERRYFQVLEESPIISGWAIPPHGALRLGFRLVGLPAAVTYARRMPEANENGTDDLLVAVGHRIRDLRQAKSMAPKDFASAAGFSLQYLWRLEDGQQNLSLRSLSRIAIALDVPMATLLEGIRPDPATVQPRPYRRRTTGV